MADRSHRTIQLHNIFHSLKITNCIDFETCYSNFFHFVKIIRALVDTDLLLMMKMVAGSNARI